MNPLFSLTDKTIAWVDPWTLQHFLAGGAVSFLVSLVWGSSYVASWSWIKVFVITFACCLGWELFEWAAEVGLWGPVLGRWFIGVEFWGNRWVTDPLAVACGVAVMHRMKYAVSAGSVSVCLAVAWLLVTGMAEDSMTPFIALSAWLASVS